MPSIALCAFLFIFIPFFVVSQSTVGTNFDFQQWKETMGRQLEEKGVQEDSQTRFAIECGLESIPELQQIMKDRHQRFVAVSGGREWPLSDFLEDLSAINAAAEAYVEKVKNRIETRSFAKSDSPLAGLLDIHALDSDSGLSRMLNRVIPSLGAAKNTLEDTVSGILPASTREMIARDLKWGQLDATWNYFSFRRSYLDELVKAFLDTITRALESIFKDMSTSTHDAVVAIHDFIHEQIAFLSKEVQEAIRAFENFAVEHPWLLASAAVGLVVFGVTVAFSPYAYLGVLHLVGFGELGPIAGSWAALFQSLVYGGQTTGLFSILQSIAMTGTVYWPISVFTGIVVAAVGAVGAFWAGEAIMNFVASWFNQGGAPFPVMPDGTLVTDELGIWMAALGEKMEESGVPHGQWFDVVIELLRRQLQSF
ncbi:hypothetical protein L218DRAFT_1081750 [Marasmius fiardii PR-910]|nr:hypothetical protein L218DRAFT_1081750 [Marasmius fiardii PR-910]